jgi:hypothetical protein
MRFVLLLLLMVTAACFKQPLKTDYVVMPYPTAAQGEWARTVCSWNNKPLVLADTSTLTHKDHEFHLEHEYQHARDMEAFKGGCWPFVYRYTSDLKFKQEIEFRAYCAEGRSAINKNRNPFDVWSRIKEAMLLYGKVLTEADNCLFNSWVMDQNKVIPPSDTLGIRLHP